MHGFPSDLQEAVSQWQLSALDHELKFTKTAKHSLA